MNFDRSKNMSSQFVSKLKDVYGHDIEQDFEMFMKGELCLITEFKGMGICYLFRNGPGYAACDGAGYFENEAFPDSDMIKYFLQTKQEHRIRVNLEKVVNDTIYRIKFESLPYSYFCSNHKSWVHYVWRTPDFYRITKPVSEHHPNQTMIIGAKSDSIICQIVAKTIEKMA